MGKMSDKKIYGLIFLLMFIVIALLSYIDIKQQNDIKALGESRHAVIMSKGLTIPNNGDVLCQVNNVTGNIESVTIDGYFEVCVSPGMRYAKLMWLDGFFSDDKNHIYLTKEQADSARCDWLKNELRGCVK